MYKASRDGFIDYNDLATQSVPLAYTTGDLQITNDWAGPYGSSANAPMGITQLWNTSTNQFDFSKLSIGDEVTLRFDLLVTTSAPNQVTKVFCTFDIWGTPFSLTLDHQYFKSAWSYNVVETEMFHIGSAGMKNNPGRMYFNSDANATIKVNWFVISVKRR